jgi:IclR family acetate operon transcriptional repressor
VRWKELPLGGNMEVVRRTLAVLRLLAERPDGYTLQELCRALDVSPPTMHRLLAVLASEGFVARATPSKRYSLGGDALRLASGARHVAEVAREDLASLRQDLGETAFVAELIGDRAVCVALVESPRPLRLFVRVGLELPLHAAASSRAILAFLDARRVRAMLKRGGLKRFTDETPATVDEVVDRFTTIRRRGYDVCDEELDPNVWAVAAPIRDLTGEVVASVTVAGPLRRMTTVKQKQVATRVVTAADSISARLGFFGGTFQAAEAAPSQ